MVSLLDELGPEEEAFRAELIEAIEASLPPGWAAGGAARGRSAQERLEISRGWQRRMNERGWVGIAWPKEAGGRGATPLQQAIYNRELAIRRAPPMANGIGLLMAGPTIILHGTETQKQRFLPGILSADELWCQLFSEPDAGSDLASLKTRGEIQGDTLVVNGQKIWTTNAHQADWAFALVRTDPNAARKHDGISYVLIDMRSPGVRVQSIRQLTGEPEFNQVFLEDVRVPLDQVVGDLNRGWYIANSTLAFERSGQGNYVYHMQALAGLIGLARAEAPAGDLWTGDRALRTRLLRYRLAVEALAEIGEQNLAAQVAGQRPGLAASVVKLVGAELRQEMAGAALELLGPAGILWRGSPRAPRRGNALYEFLNSAQTTIAAGTSEIQRNIIGERILGLPKEPAVESVPSGG